ncbi:MAG: NAD(P)/FAD-dependent oxidoreductase [Byssovorax sp.]
MDLDLAIVGGGPAGIATALFLAAAAPRRIARVAIFEKERYPREKICAGAIGWRAEKELARIGVRVDVPSAWVHGLSVATATGSLQARDPRILQPIGRVVRRFEYDAAFADEARARGVTIVEGARVQRVEIADDGVRLHGTMGEIRARAVIGADGVGSFVRRAIGAPTGRWRAQVIEVDTPAIEGDLARDLLHFDLGDRGLRGYAWDFPTIVEGRALRCRGLYELSGGDDAEGDGIDLAERLTARLVRQGIDPAGLRFKRFSERGLALHEPLARPRALLVGEAAGIDPALGEGIAQAILYGAVAGPYLARCLDRGDLSFGDWPRSLRRSRVGLDLRARELATPWLYDRMRPELERWTVLSRDLALTGVRYFAGERVEARRVAGAAIDLGRAVMQRARDTIAASVK